MNISKEVLSLLEKNNEEVNTIKIKDFFHINSDRNARVILNILETSPEKWLDKIAKEIKKMEAKKLKEFRKINKKMESFSFNDTSTNNSKLYKLENEISELKRLMA
jgi:hypothetical protein